jgi:hypothetical protein
MTLFFVCSIWFYTVFVVDLLSMFIAIFKILLTFYWSMVWKMVYTKCFIIYHSKEEVYFVFLRLLKEKKNIKNNKIIDGIFRKIKEILIKLIWFGCHSLSILFWQLNSLGYVENWKTAVDMKKLRRNF